MYFEEGVYRGKITYDNTWCAMVMGFLELLLFHGFIMCSEDGVNQGSEVVGGRVRNMLIFHKPYTHYGARA